MLRGYEKQDKQGLEEGYKSKFFIVTGQIILYYESRDSCGPGYH